MLGVVLNFRSINYLGCLYYYRGIIRVIGVIRVTKVLARGRCR